ncbi:MAG: FAD-dependent oxidoreductase [Pseudomonadota bacterium]
MVAHTGSWYAASLPDDLKALRPRLDADLTCDVCIVGAGFAGTSAAYHLAKTGKSVVVLDATRVGWGASGRNGGQLHPGMRQELSWFAKKLGENTAHQVREASKAALDHLHSVIAEADIDCDLTPGLITACRSQEDFEEELEGASDAHARFGVEKLEVLNAAQTEEALTTAGHVGALRDPEGGHLHPLKLVTSLAKAAEAYGAQFFDETEVQDVRDTAQGVEVVAAGGTVRAQEVVLAGNGYMRGLNKDADARILPITNFIVATKPMGVGRSGGILPFGDAAADTRFIVRYWRPTADGRLVFGGGEKFSRTFPRDIEAFVRPHLKEVYPDLADVEIDFAWGGTLAITQNRLPLIRRMSERVTVAAGFSGQGVIMAPFAGKIVADALTYDSDLLDVMSALPCPAFPGGTALRSPLLFLAMSYYALRDRLG